MRKYALFGTALVAIIATSKYSPVASHESEDNNIKEFFDNVDTESLNEHFKGILPEGASFDSDELMSPDMVKNMLGHIQPLFKSIKAIAAEMPAGENQNLVNSMSNLLEKQSSMILDNKISVKADEKEAAEVIQTLLGKEFSEIGKKVKDLLSGERNKLGEELESRRMNNIITEQDYDSIKGSLISTFQSHEAQEIITKFIDNLKDKKTYSSYFDNLLDYNKFLEIIRKILVDSDNKSKLAGFVEAIQTNPSKEADIFDKIKEKFDTIQDGGVESSVENQDNIVDALKENNFDEELLNIYRDSSLPAVRL